MNKPKPQHVPMDQFKTADNCLLVNGQSVLEIAQKLGRTPFYAYDSNLMTARVKQLREALPKEIHLHYAMKANPMLEVVKHMADLVDGLDVASKGELEVALQTGTAPGNISFAGPGKRDEELLAAIEAKITINVESEGELARIDKIATRLGSKPNIAIRVNPDFELKSSGMKMGGGPKQFGIDAERVPAVLKHLANLDCHFRGFHIFSGSQNLKPEAIIEAHDKTFELAIRLSEYASTPVELLNIGGGFGIPYFPGESRLNLEPIVANLNRLLPEVLRALPETEIVTELGRYLVGEAGVYICKIIDKKVSRGHTFLIVDGGLHHHLSASGNFGQVIRKNYPVAVANRMERSEEKELVSVVGPLCTPLDLLADKVELPVAEPGDLIAVYQSGAYGYSASPHGFLSHPCAREILV